jgi:hypothetical protein
MGFTDQLGGVMVRGDAARHERKIVPKRRFQEGCIRMVGKPWVLYYVDTLNRKREN